MRRHAAHGVRWLQWAVTASIAGAVGWAALHTASRAPQDTLYITLGELRSRAAEAREIAHNAAASRLTGTYVRAQAGQLASRIATLADDLAMAEPRGSNRADRAHQSAARLLAVTQTLAQQGDSVTATATLEHELDAIVTALIPLEREARP